MSASTRRLLSNTVVLGILQLLNYLPPLLVLPYLAKILLLDEFGAVMAAMSASVMVYVITDFGFNLSAVHKISRNSENKKYIDGLVSVIFTAKLFLSSIATIAFLIAANLSPYKNYNHIFFCGVVAIFSQAFQPIWLFHGLEKIKHFFSYFFLTKFIYVVFVYLFVQRPGDGYVAMASWSVANFFGCAISLFLLRKMGYKLAFSNRRRAYKEIRKNITFFVSRAATMLYTSACPFVLGNFSLQQAAVYSVAEQGYKAGQAVVSAAGQALYPYMTKEKNWKIFIRIILTVELIILFGVGFVAYFADFFIIKIFGTKFTKSIDVFRMMMLALPFSCLSAMCGYPAFSAMNKIEWANRTTLLGTFVFLFLLLLNFLIFKISAISLAVIVLATEIFVLACRLFLLFSGHFAKPSR